MTRNGMKMKSTTEEKKEKYKISDIEHGDIVSYIDNQGKIRSGKAVMRSSFPDSWVLNIGGRYGIPQIVSPQNFIGIKRKLKKVI